MSNTIGTLQIENPLNAPSATGTDAGLMSPSDKSKLDGVEAGATANSTDAQLRDRTTHTGVQTAVTISDFSTAADARVALHGNLTNNPHATTKAQVGLSNVDNTSDALKPVSTAQAAADAAVQAFAIQRANHTGTQAAGTITGLAAVATSGLKADVGLGNVDNTSDANKPVSTAQQTALNLKANLASPTFTGTVSGITKAMVGLGNVDNTSDASKPVSTLQQAALDLKANLASPTFTGTVSGITKAMVGLGNVDNTSDANKPVSTAQQTALDLKYNASNPNGYETPTQLNARDTANRSRANHTGTQVASTISDFSTAADARITAQKGAANGLATLDGTTKIPIAQVPTAAPSNIGTANTEGTSTSVARADHTHNIDTVVRDSEAVPNSFTPIKTWNFGPNFLLSSGGAGIANIFLNLKRAIAQVNTGQTISSATFVDITGVTTTFPVSGTYLAVYSGTFTFSNASRFLDVILVNNGVNVTASQRQVSSAAGGQALTVMTFDIVTGVAAQILKAQAQISANTVTVSQQTLALFKIA